MIHFEIPEDVKTLLDVLKDFASQEIRPYYREWEKKKGIPSELAKKYHDLGMAGMKLPESMGGSNLNLEASIYVTETLSQYGDIGVFYALPGPGFGGDFILNLGSEEQVKRLLLPFLSGEGYLKKTALLLREENPDFSWEEITTIAKTTPEGYTLHGKKTFAMQAADAELCIILAKDESSQEPGIYVAEKGASGLEISPPLELLGLRTVGFYDVTLNGVPIKKENKLENASLEKIQKVWNKIRLKNASACVGATKAGCEEAFKYGNERVTFGQTLWQHQGLAFFMADMAVKLEMADSLLVKTAVEFETATLSDIAQALALVEDNCVKVTSDAVQALGGAGYMQDYPVEKWMRDVRTASVVFELDPYFEHQIFP